MIAFRRGFTKRRFRVQDDFLVFSSHEVIDDMGRGGISTRVTKPFGAYKTLHDGCRRVDATITV